MIDLIYYDIWEIIVTFGGPTTRDVKKIHTRGYPWIKYATGKK